MSNLIQRARAALAKPVDYQEVRLKPSPVWSQAVVWAIIGTASFGFLLLLQQRLMKLLRLPESCRLLVHHGNYEPSTRCC